MVLSLIAGQNAPLPQATISLRVVSDTPIDCACYRLTDLEKVRGDGDMIFYGQTHSDDNSVSFRGHETDGIFDIYLNRQPPEIKKVVLAFSSDKPLNTLGNIQLSVIANNEVIITANTHGQNRNEKALILAECYLRQGVWKIRFVEQGFDGGLKPLSEYFGVEIADNPTPTQAPPKPMTPPSPPPKPSTINLSKITLTKSNQSINLQKQDDFGKIAINLNWNNQKQPSGFFGSVFGGQGVDLDLGAFIALKNGDKQVIQALGGNFGQFDYAPYLKLKGDDRTGQSKDGEWIEINGKYWQYIDEVLIYAFIYSGVPNWQQTDGVVTVYVEGKPPIETRLTEGTNQLNMCAIVRLINDKGSIKVERIDQYFQGHQNMDRAFNWGFSWRRGSK